MDKYLFLDFDGVITTLESHWNLCPKKLKLLGKIIDSTGCKLVISSSWRRNNLEQTIDSLSNPKSPFHAGIAFPFCNKIIGVTARMYGFEHGVRETHFRIPRGVEIEHWLRVNISDFNNKQVGIDYTYAILDDDPDMLLEQAPYYIQTSWGDGMNEKDVERAIEILNKLK